MLCQAAGCGESRTPRAEQGRTAEVDGANVAVGRGQWVGVAITDVGRGHSARNDPAGMAEPSVWVEELGRYGTRIRIHSESAQQCFQPAVEDEGIRMDEDE